MQPHGIGCGKATYFKLKRGDRVLMKFLVRRVLYCLLVVLGVSVIVFLIVHLTPGDPVYLMVSDAASEAEIEAMREKWGFNRPLYVQYGIFLSQLLQGDLGQSLFYKTDCLSIVMERLGPTLELTVTGMVLALLVGIPLGVMAGLKRGSARDLFTMFFAMIGQSMSPVWMSILLIFVFSVRLRIFPTYGYGTFGHLVLPMITVGLPMASLIARLTRSGMVDTLSEDYILALRAKGVPKKQINFKYALKNVLIPVVNMVGIKLGYFMGGAVVTETIFGWPGVGTLVVNAILSRDYPLVQAAILVTSILFVVINMIVDIICTFINPQLTFD